MTRNEDRKKEQTEVQDYSRERDWLYDLQKRTQKISHLGVWSDSPSRNPALRYEYRHNTNLYEDLN